MAPKDPGRGELAKPVANHILGDEQGHVSPAIVHSYGETQHVRHDHRVSGPGLYNGLTLTAAGCIHLLSKFRVNVRAFFY